jgi:lysophospholipase L1-like esterase
MSFIRKHPRLTLVAIQALILVALALAAELVLRFLVSYRIDYYTYVSTSSSVLKYPYGDIFVNSHGYPDVEWDLTDRRARIGVIGDSVTWGVGAGAGYRYTDLLAKRFLDRAFFNFSGVGQNGIEGDEDIEEVLGLVRRYGLKKVVYGMNLNDILPPNEPGKPARHTFVTEAMDFATEYFDYLRGRSYLYTTLRTQVKVALLRLGYEMHGLEAFELMPSKNEKVIRDTAGRINALARALGREGVGFCVVVFPYEMQISAEAAKTYAGLGIKWEAAFENGLTQKILMSSFDRSFTTVDVLDGFRKIVGDTKAARVGEYFVYNKGDKLDWNHPNRAGHRVIADYLATAAPECVKP